MSYEVHASVYGMQPKLSETVVDRTGSEPDGEELLACDDAVLGSCNPRDRAIAGLVYRQTATS